MTTEFDSNQASAFFVDPSDQHSSVDNRPVGTVVDDDEILRDFRQSDRSAKGGETETLCGCSGSCNCSSCNCLSDRAVENADESSFDRFNRSLSGSNLGDTSDDDIRSIVYDELQDNRTDGEGNNFEALRDRLGDEKGGFVEELISRIQRTDDRDSFIDLNSIDFTSEDQKTSDS